MADYCTAAEVAAHLGKTFTAAQTTEANLLIPAATAWINDRTGRSWPQTSAITDERHTVEGTLLYLSHAPIASVASVKVRPPTIGASDTTLTLASGYEVVDTALGLLRLSSSYLGWTAKVSYTPAVALDSRLSLAAKKLVAFWMRPLLEGLSGDIVEYSVGQELRVKFANPASALGVPPDVAGLVDSINPQMVFA